MAAYTTIDDPEAHFQVKAYTGTGSELALTLDGDTDMQPDMTWIFCRSLVKNQYLFDSLRGATKHITPNDVDAEGTDANTLTSFNSDGFTVGTSGGVNTSSATFASWNWKANGTGSSNTTGSINTTATSANTTSGFSIITYEGNGTSGATIGHGLGVAPTFILLHHRDMTGGAAEPWRVYHDKNTSAPATDYLALNTTAATADDSNAWNDTAPNSTLITLGNGGASNTDDKNFVAYCWADVQGFSKFGSYTGNGNADGTFIYTGFRPAMVITKATGATENWSSFDNKRLGYNPKNYSNDVNVNIVERTTEDIDILSNGFKLRQTNSRFNTSGGTYIYMAFAEAPFVNSNGVPCNAR